MRLFLALIAVSLIAIGVGALLAPKAAAAGFGIAADTPEARVYLRAAGARDLALGAALFTLLRLRAPRRMLAAIVFATAFIAACDALNVLVASGGQVGLPLFIHAGGFLVLLAGGWRLGLAETNNEGGTPKP